MESGDYYEGVHFDGGENIVVIGNVFVTTGNVIHSEGTSGRFPDVKDRRKRESLAITHAHISGHGRDGMVMLKDLQLTTRRTYEDVVVSCASLAVIQAERRGLRFQLGTVVLASAFTLLLLSLGHPFFALYSIVSLSLFGSWLHRYRKLEQDEEREVARIDSLMRCDVDTETPEVSGGG